MGADTCHWCERGEMLHDDEGVYTCSVCGARRVATGQGDRSAAAATSTQTEGEGGA